VDRSRISALKVNGPLVTAAVLVGKRKLRTVTRLGTHLEVECQCSENRSSGTVCAHGVAVALAAFGGASSSSSQSSEADPVAVDHPLVACRVIFPPGFERGLAAGRLGVRIEESSDSPDESDRSLSQWLGSHAAGAPFPLLLTFRTEEAANFLESLGGHSRLESHNGARLMSPSDSAADPLRLADSRLQNGRVRLDLEAPITAFKWGDSVGVLSDAGFGRVPARKDSVHWRDEVIELATEGSVELPVADFLKDIDAWMDLLQSPYQGWLAGLRFETRAPDSVIHIEGSLNALDVNISTDDGSGASLSDDGKAILTPDQGAFEHLMNKLTGFGFKFQGSVLALRDHDQIVDFLADGIRSIEAHGRVVVGDRLKHVRKSLHVIRPQYEFSNTGNLSCELSFQTDGGKAVPRSKVMEILRSGKSSVKTRAGAEVVVSRVVADELEPLLSDLGIVRPEGRLQLDHAQQECLKVLADPGGRDQAPDVVPSQAGAATLRDYQRDGANWILDRWSRFGGALLADEMGLGKTLQTISAIAKLKRDGELGRTLVLVPTSLLSNWEGELARFGTGLSVVRMHGPNRDSLRLEGQTCDVVLTSYGTLVRDLAFHLKQDYQTLIVDEASLLRNPDSEISRTVAKLNPRRRLALTGTPVENRLRDLWSIFRVVSPGYLGAKDEFLERYEQGDSGDTSRLRIRISPFTLRRTKLEVAKDLPSRLEIDQWVDLTPEIRAIYREVAQAGLSQWEDLDEAGKGGAASMHLLTTLLRLRQICLDPGLVGDGLSEDSGAKIEWLDRLLEERLGQGGKVLVFSQFTKFLRQYESRAKTLGMEAFRLDGSTTNRGKLVEEFQKTEKPAVFLISLKAGGYGLNLTAADTVVHMDPWWNPAAEAQASDRAHRIGQTRPVSIYRLLTKNSVEERVRRLQDAKRGLIDQLNGSTGVSALQHDDVVDLLR